MIGSTLGNYKILEKLGEGGQGTVYKAIDSKLGRTLVIKVLPAELTSKEANLKRFEREARLASALDHPNICTIFDLNEINGIHFIAMQYIEGRNVRQLVNGRPLSLESALSIALQTADALAAAHSRGIIHRDIKAGNVMVTPSGQVKVLDFGLAKLLDEDAARTSGIHHTEITEVGVPYGTATYAAPEQARGDRVDSRADIFSTGVLLYEMLTGTWPFQGQTSVEVRHAVLHDEPKLISQMRPGRVPAKLQAIIDKSLAKDPRNRYQKIAYFANDLREVIRELGADSLPGIDESAMPIEPKHLTPANPVTRALRWLTGNKSDENALGGSGKSTTRSRDQHASPLTSLADDERKSVAILPFQNVGNERDIDFYQFSLADAVITELARVRSLVVRPSSVIVKYQNKTVDAADAGRELRVDAILTATFLRAGDRLRVTAQLLDVRTSEILWSERIDADASDIIGVQDTIVQRIVEGLRLELSPDERVQLAKGTTTVAAASEEYMRGRDCLATFIYHTIEREHLDSSIEHFRRAIEIDPQFALAYSALGSAYVNRVLKGLGQTGDHEKAQKAFGKALALDPKLLEARRHMVFIYLTGGQKQTAREEIELLRDEYPNDSGVQFVRGVVARLDGDYETALRSFDRMVKLNPEEQVLASYNRARIFMYQQKYDEALRELDAGAALEPEHPVIKVFRARVLYYRGEIDEAAEILHQVLIRHPQMDGIRPILAICLSAQGQHTKANEQLTQKVRQVAEADYDISYWLASAYLLQGRQVEALRWLETATRLGNENYRWFESDPNWTDMHEDPRFVELMNGIKNQNQAARDQTV
ncbi:MAG: protein kinase [Acidobacteria bacterium]|nr:protein kinase [Acidobacteriota bacterium]MCA1627525.1 protein kinase [Acidobacteriota bacterium]